MQALSSASNLAVLSPEPDTQVRPSGLMATEVIQSEWPSSVAFTWPVPMSHSLCKGGVVWCGVARRRWSFHVYAAPYMHRANAGLE